MNQFADYQREGKNKNQTFTQQNGAEDKKSEEFTIQQIESYIKTNVKKIDFSLIQLII